MQRIGVEPILHPFFAFDATSPLTQCYHLDANIDTCVNGPLILIHSVAIQKKHIVVWYIQSYLTVPN